MKARCAAVTKGVRCQRRPAFLLLSPASVTPLAHSCGTHLRPILTAQLERFGRVAVERAA